MHALLQVWDVRRLERDVAFHSRITYTGQQGRITSVAGVQDGQSVASASAAGSVHVWRVEYTTRVGGAPDKYTGAYMHRAQAAMHGVPTVFLFCQAQRFVKLKTHNPIPQPRGGGQAPCDAWRGRCAAGAGLGQLWLPPPAAAAVCYTARWRALPGPALLERCLGVAASSWLRNGDALGVRPLIHALAAAGQQQRLPNTVGHTISGPSKHLAAPT